MTRALQSVTWFLAGLCARTWPTWRLWLWLEAWCPLFFIRDDRGLRLACLSVGDMWELTVERFTWKPAPWRTSKDAPR